MKSRSTLAFPMPRGVHRVPDYHAEFQLQRWPPADFFNLVCKFYSYFHHFFWIFGCIHQYLPCFPSFFLVFPSIFFVFLSIFLIFPLYLLMSLDVAICTCNKNTFPNINYNYSYHISAVCCDFDFSIYPVVINVFVLPALIDSSVIPVCAVLLLKNFIQTGFSYQRSCLHQSIFTPRFMSRLHS